MKKEDVPFIAFIISITVSITVCYFLDAARDIRAAQYGLQQCEVGSKILWQKECGK